MHDDLTNQIDALRRQIRGRGHTYEDLAIEAEVQRIRTAAATLVINQLLQAHEVLIETGQQLLPAPVQPQAIAPEHYTNDTRYDPVYGEVPTVDNRHSSDLPRFMNGRQRVA